MDRRRPGTSRQAVEGLHGRNSVASLPGRRSAERFTSPRGEPVVALRDPGHQAVRDLARRDDFSRVRFWLSPCGDHFHAWTAGDVTHFQLYGDLEDHGWHTGTVRFGDGPTPILTVQDPVAELLVSGRAIDRLAGGPYLVHTSLRTIDGKELGDVGSPAP